MRVCVIGKFPPIQGGVSMRTYWTAHGLAARGHDVHVVTNAKEAEPPFRMHMRPGDWRRCGAAYGSGSVTVHWTDPVDRSQSYIPMASPFVSKLAGLAARVHSQRPFDVVYSHYLEPYGVAGHLAAQMAGVPHVVRMAGSDAGRLWHHPQLAGLYDHILGAAAVVIAGGMVADRAVQRGVDPDRIAFAGAFAVPEDVFTPHGPVLDFAALRREVARDPASRALLWGNFSADAPYFGICGKLGDSKGSFALLAAMDRLKRAGLDLGLVALAHGYPAVERRFRARGQQLGLADRILQIPFLPHWRVPEFLRGCLAVCCLEQDFPIGFHAPIIPMEALLCGTCLVASTEVIRKLPAYGRLPHGYGCVAVEDVNDIDALSDRLAAIAKDPAPAAAVGARGCAFAREMQRDSTFPHALERILQMAVARWKVETKAVSAAEPKEGRFAFTQLAAAAMRRIGAKAKASKRPVAPKRVTNPAQARAVVAALERAIIDGHAELKSLALAVAAEIAVATAEDDIDTTEPAPDDPLFRLRIGRWALAPAEFAELLPVRDRRLRVLAFDYDVSPFLVVNTVADVPAPPVLRRSYVVAFGRRNGERRSPLLVDAVTARILQLSDGTRTARQIARELDGAARRAEAKDHLSWIEHLFVQGLVSLQDSTGAATIETPYGVGLNKSHSAHVRVRQSRRQPAVGRA